MTATPSSRRYWVIIALRPAKRQPQRQKEGAGVEAARRRIAKGGGKQAACRSALTADELRDCQASVNKVGSGWFPHLVEMLMEILLTSILCYVAIGVAFFAHPASPVMPDDFHWRAQIGVFWSTLPDVLAWPLTLWRFGCVCLGRD